ncbi:MAG: S16 family serine protease [Nitrospiraceae bacterium]
MIFSRDNTQRSRLWRLLPALCALLLCLTAAIPEAAGYGLREKLVPILGVTVEKGKEPTGMVTHLLLSFQERTDRSGLAVQFRSTPGRFSHLSQTAVQQAIYRAAKVAGLSTDTWTVMLSVPEPGLTVYGDSLSAMVALTVVALAKGDEIPPDRVLTGTVTTDGHIAHVGSLPLKVGAAYQAHIRRVLVPDELDITDRDWETPFLMQVSPVGSVSQAYRELTDHPLLP